MKSLIDDLVPSELTLIASRPSVGKTSLAATLAKAMAERNVGVQFCSLKMPADALTRCMIFNDIRKQQLEQSNVEKSCCEEIVRQEVEELKGLPIYVDDSVVDADELASRIAVAAKEHSVGLVVVDYLQLCVDNGNMANAVRRFGEVAKKHSLRVVLLSQLKRSFSAQRPKLADIAELEQYADNIWLLTREERQLVVDILKCRNGIVRECRMPVNFRANWLGGWESYFGR